MTNPTTAGDLIGAALPDRSPTTPATAWSISEIAEVKKTLDTLIRKGNLPDQPDMRGSYPPVCEAWEWDACYAEQYNAVLSWILGIACSCQGHTVLPTRGLWFCGNLGTGKSTLMRAVKIFCSLYADARSGNMPRPMRWMHAKDIVADYEQYGSRSLDELTEVETLIIDDLGTEDKAAMRYGSVKNVVEEILSRRYDRRKMTMVTTNYTMTDVRLNYRTRIFDRVRESMNIIEFRGKSRRRDFNPGVTDGENRQQ